MNHEDNPKLTQAEDTPAYPKWAKSLPNQLSLFRMSVVPVLLILFPFEIKSLNVFCAVLFMLAAITDWLDGFLARKFQAESKLGAIIDPIADKVIMAAALLLIASTGAIWTWMAGFLLCREIGINGLRLVASQHGMDLKVSQLGKAKTVALDVAIVCLMVNFPLFGWPFREVGMISIWVAFLLSFYSAFLYFSGFWKMTKTHSQPSPSSNPPPT